MKKIVVARAGGYDELRIEAHADEAPRAGEVVVACEAIGVNYADCIVRMGLYASARKYVGWPITPGFEVAGNVARVGAGVTDLREGDDVLAVTRFGGYASEVRVPRDQVFLRPSTLSVSQAAAFPAVSLTAYFALFELANVREGQRILVHSAAGGVGSALLALARIAKLDVVAIVGGPPKVQVARDLGARVVIDKSREKLWPAVERASKDGYHVILDANGAETLAQSYAHLASPGKLVVYGFHTMLPRQGGKPNWARLAVDWLRTPRFNPLQMTNENRSVLAFNLSYLFEEKSFLRDAMGKLLAWVSSGEMAAPKVTTYAFERVADAHRDIESGKTTGKLVLVV
jgi:NADPH:quinone reductase-like Zn-dependent oxidoreductase